jgi:hypothetical protein
MSVVLIVLFAVLPAAAEIREAAHVPWSGHWWPHTQGGLGTGRDYYGAPAPIEKYEWLTRGASPGPLRDWYLQNHFDPEAPHWYGLCYEWAQAAAFEAIEFWPSVENNILFRVGDKKGLMTLAHEENLEEAAHGQYPEVFHYWLLQRIGEEGRPFMADLDPGEEVWSYPIFKFEMDSSVAGTRESVRTTVWYADNDVHPDFMGAKTRRATYTYDLLLDAAGRIVGGEWTGVSRKDHPKRLAVPLVPLSRAPELDYMEVRRIAEARDDEWERGEAVVDAPPGTHYLVLMDPDHYRIHAQSGDAVSLEVAKLPGSLQDPEISVFDGDGVAVQIGSASSNQPFSFIVGDANPPYTISLTQEDYGDPNLYTLTVDVRRRFVAHVPFLPGAGLWSGFALTNPAETQVEGLHLVSVDSSGKPVQTLSGPETLPAGGKRMFTFTELPYRDHERERTDRLIVTADAPLEVVNLLGGNGMANLSDGANRAASRLVLPDTVGGGIGVRSVSGTVVNPSLDRTAAVHLRVFTATGVPHSETEIGLPPGEKMTISAGGAPFFSLPEGGWIEAVADPDTPILAFQYARDRAELETLFGLKPVDGQAVVPHVTLGGGPWETRLTLINLSDEANEIVLSAMAEADGASNAVVSLFPREKRSLELGALFGRGPGDPLFRSTVSVSGGAAFSGMFSYRRGSGGDSADFPLMGADLVKPELVLPHCPGKGNWWTGLAVANPGTFPARVRVLPHDAEGRPMAGAETEVFIEPGRYFLSTAGALFADAANRVAYVVFRPADPANHLMGLYLYGNLDEGGPETGMFTGGAL